VPTFFFAEASAVTVTVEVINDTPGGTPVAGDEAFLKVVHHGQLVKEFTGKVDADNKIIFADVPAEAHNVALARVKHQGMMFNSQTVSLPENRATRSLKVFVYDVSEDKSKLSVPVHHILIKAEQGVLQVNEYIQLKNASGMAITSGEKIEDQPVVLDISLPKGFKDIQYLSYLVENAIVETEDGFFDTMAVPPGDNHLTFSYSIDIDSKDIDFSKKITLPTSSMIISAELGQATLQGLGQPTSQAFASDGTPKNYYKVTDLEKDSVLTFQLTGFNVASANKDWIISIVVFAVVLVIVIVKLSGNKKQTETGVISSDE
jgi:hypothetical protein